MRCKLIREIEVSPGVMSPEFVAANAVARQKRRNCRLRHVMFWKVGTVFDLPDSFRLVQHGCALPDDKECEEAAGMTPEESAAAQHAYGRLENGIHPDDFDLYDNEVIVGYDEKGNYKPGPNFHLLEEAAAEAESAEVVTAQGDE